MAELSEQFAEAKRELGLKLAGQISRKLTSDGIDPALLAYFREAEGAALLVRPQKESRDPGLTSVSVRQTEADIAALGFDLTAPKLLERVEITEESLLGLIPELRKEIELAMKENFLHLSKKELNLLLQLDIPNDEARQYLIELLFGEGSLRRHPTRIIDSCEELTKILNGEITEEEKFNLSAALVANGEPIPGPTQRKVEPRRTLMSAANDRSYHDVVRSVVTGKDGLPTIQSTQRFTDDEMRFMKARKDHSLEYTESNFAYCIFQLALLPENIAWITDPENHHMYVSRNIADQMLAIECMSIDYEFFMYTNHVEGALRAFMRVYLGVYNDKALRIDRGVEPKQDRGHFGALLRILGILKV
ncbi:MAG: hypothetical protein U1D98_01835 [Candidatus Gracilibacteria bacterium]|nr:hypothetical protein [Candidatus Gracilibacteria bacterium]